VGEVDAPDSFEAISGGETALGLAAGHTYHFHHTNHTRTARLLLDAGADPNARCGAGNTAAHRAAAAGNAGVVRELLARGARVDWKAWDAKGRTAEQVAREAGHAGVAEMIAGR
jgi:ankyrin repeat protein